MNWHSADDDYFMIEIPVERAQVQLAMFAIHLSMGNNIYCRRIKLDTIKEYIYAVARLTAVYRKTDIRKDNVLDQNMGKSLDSVYKELKRWEDVPNRREAFTPQMLLTSIQLAMTAGLDSLVKALVDWFVVGIFAGLRCGEYAQTSTQAIDPDKPTLNERGDTRAFTLNDIRVRTKDGRTLRGSEILDRPYAETESLWLKFRTQKNGKHGAERLFRPSPDSNNGICIVKAMRRIIDRFIRLRGADDFTTPLSVYKSSSDEILLITSTEITQQIREVAVATYQLDWIKDKDEIQRWSAHSLRVGACVFLHAAGFSALDIKWILRWESDAYMVYLRNFIGLSDRQSQAFAALDPSDSTVAMPALSKFFVENA